MKKFTVLLFAISIVLTFYSYGQNQGNIWYFGEGAGVDFNSGNPIAINDGQTYNVMNHSEGTAAICDSTGSLLFYSNGEKVWDKNHSIMPNGDSLLGHYSSTHAAFILPKPGFENIYYLFTSDSGFDSNLQHGLRYSVIDMCLNKGDGDIVSGYKNIALLDDVSEKITATKHANNIDYWLITHQFYSNSFYAFRLTSNGIEDTIISNVGSIHQGSVSGAIGQLKTSPDGSKIGIASGNGNNLIELFDFDNSTGYLSNPINLPRNHPDTRGYGLSFSPDNSKVYYYLTTITPTVETYIAQFDLTAGGGHPDSVSASEEVIWYLNNTSCPYGGLQLGPDGKIYKVSCSNTQYLDKINNPNATGLNSDFQSAAVNLNGKTGSYTLPSYVDSYDYPNTMPNCEQTDLNELNDFINCRVFPNPSNNQVTFIFNNTGETFSLSLYDTQGQQIRTISNITSNKLTMDVDDLNSGLYIYQLYSEGHLRFSSKLIIE